MSAGWGPVTRQPSAASAAIAGSMISISSRPERAAFAGVRIERRTPPAAAPRCRNCAAAREAPRGRAIRPGAALSCRGDLAPTATWVVTGTVRNVGPASIITTLSGETPQRSATNSVCPGCWKPIA